MNNKDYIKTEADKLREELKEYCRQLSNESISFLIEKANELLEKQGSNTGEKKRNNAKQYIRWEKSHRIFLKSRNTEEKGSCLFEKTFYIPDFNCIIY